MNNPVTNLADAAWSKMEVLSTMRRFIQNELNYPDSLPAGFSTEKLQSALVSIDSFSGEFSYFLSLKNTQPDPTYLEDKFDELSNQYNHLMQELESLVN
ncbi:MAG: hypothetical protein IT258_05975 [Saprospiraceae bacterium]|nr:hypothetical protein [Saprospiraceae bacterium]